MKESTWKNELQQKARAALVTQDYLPGESQRKEFSGFQEKKPNGVWEVWEEFLDQEGQTELKGTEKTPQPKLNLIKQAFSMNPSFIVIIIFPQLTETCLICPCFISHFCFLFAISVTLMGSITSCLKSESPANLCLSTWTLNPSMLPACPDAFFPSQYEQLFSIQPCWLTASSRKLSLDPLSWKLYVPPLKPYSTFFLQHEQPLSFATTLNYGYLSPCLLL